jgi:hypothetical protein
MDDGRGGARVSSVRRPGAFRWLWYAIGGSLPSRYDEWVLHDTTCRTWLLRHVVRSLIVLSVPVAMVIAFLPTSVGLSMLTALAAGGSGLMFMLVHTIEATERRAIRAGYPGGTAEATRAQRSADTQRSANAARRERAAARAARR